MTTEIKKPKSRRKLQIIIGASAIAALIIAAGIFYYLSYIAPFSKAVAKVDDTSITMGYFLKRAKVATGDDPSTVIEQLVYEQIVKKMAPTYGLDVSPGAVDETLRKDAIIDVSGNYTPGASQMSDAEFSKWYEEQLKRTKLSDGEFRDVIRTNLLAMSLATFLADRVPTSGEQVDLNAILVETINDANQARERILAGEPFSSVASNVTLDTQTQANGGHIGWIPRNVIPYDDVVFQLELGKVSEPTTLVSTTPRLAGYALFMVSDKASDRPIDDGPMQVLKSRAFYDWLRQELPRHVINYNLTEKTWEWVYKQLAGETGT